MSLYINSLHTQAYYRFTFPCIHSLLPIVSRKISSPKGQYETVSYGVLNPCSFSLNNSCVLNGDVLKKKPIAIIMYTKVSSIPSNQLLLPSRAIKFSIIAARKIVTSSNNVNTKENG